MAMRFPLPDGSLVILNGGNSGAGLEGTTDYTTTAPASGIVSFTYEYGSARRSRI